MGARLQALEELAERQDLYRRAFDAENYHLEQDKQGGYWTAEILQLVCGAQVVEALAKCTIKGAQWASKGGKVAKRVQQGVKVEQDVIKGVKLVEESKMAEEEIKVIRTGTRQFLDKEVGEHFVKHGFKIGEALGKQSYNIADYIEDANYIVGNGTWVPELNGYVKLIGGPGKIKYGFVGLDRITGNIKTFHIKSGEKLSKKAPSLGLNF